jgi:hypothetical protein
MMAKATKKVLLLNIAPIEFILFQSVLSETAEASKSG